MSALPGFDTWLSGENIPNSVCDSCEREDDVCEHGICVRCARIDYQAGDTPCCMDGVTP